jgi:DNA-binding response OmpR family regulator
MRILLVEDDNLIGTMVRLNLEQEGFGVDWHRSGEAGLQAVHGTRYDLMLLDIGLPGKSGIEVAKELRKQGVGTPVLMLTARDDVQSKVSALDGGADDYLTKPFQMPELIARVRAQIRRSQGSLEVPSDQVVQVGGATVDATRRVVKTRDGVEAQLSDKELALLLLFARNPSRVLTRADILEEVWGMDASPTERTIDNFVVRIRRWVEEKAEEPQHVITVRGWGYRYDP